MRTTLAVLVCLTRAIIGQAPTLLPPASTESPQAWPQVELANAREVELRGPLGDALRRGVARLDMAPYTVEWILADLSFEVDRRYTNFSGDVSGRFVELAALTSPPGKQSPATLAPVLAAISRDQDSRFQKPDGHFGVDIDLTEELVEDSPPLCLLWGNARLLVGLLASAREYGDPRLLAAAKRLGDFYVATSDQLCNPRREAEYRASGTWGHSYTCDYFPAIEGLAMLYCTTKDDRYLKQAQQMAAFFTRFDALPNDHSHGNLSAWRGILRLYEITGDRTYLARAQAKWESAVEGGFVWPIGGIGEQWRPFYRAGETCSQADWLRFCLDLWRFTGEARYLDVADRLLHNQYPVSQCDTGGYGDLYFDGEGDAGPVAAIGSLEADYCCCFAGPLALHILKSYLAVGSDRGIYVTLPFDFTSSVKAGGRAWRVAVSIGMDECNGEASIHVALAPEDGAAEAQTTLWLHMPDWASGVKEASVAGKAITPTIENGYLRINGDFRAGENVTVVLHTGLTLEGRRFRRIAPKTGEVARFRDISILAGPRILSVTMPKSSSGRVTLLATVDGTGQLDFPSRHPHGYGTVSLLDLDMEESRLGAAIQSAPVVSLRPWSRIWPEHRDVFAFDVIVVPVDSVLAAAPDVENDQPKKPAKDLPMPGEVFDVQGHTAFLIMPEQPAETAPWVWYAPTLAKYPGSEEQWMFERFTDAGIAIAGVDVGESYGNPKGRAVYTALYEQLVQKRGLSRTPCLLARSRGGLMLYNWAVEHPEAVAGVAGIYPVCDLRSYPGIKTACLAYDMTEQQLTDQLDAHNPVSRVEPLAKARVPIFHIHGDIDSTVPLQTNSAALAQHYRQCGGQMRLVVIKGQGHNMWSGWFQCQELVDFVIVHAIGRTPKETDARGDVVPENACPSQ